VFFEHRLKLDLGLSRSHDEDRSRILKRGNDLLVKSVQLHLIAIAMVQFSISFLGEFASELRPTGVVGRWLDVGGNDVNPAAFEPNEIRLLVVNP